MTLRFVSGVLWFIAGWFVVGTIAIALGLNQAVGPLVGFVWAAVVVVDPKNLVWRVGKGSSAAGHRRGPGIAASRPQVGANP
ncbi:MAG: hypothetical protein ACHQ01_06230 [Candidatus Limnocylindrales bacterium]